MVSLISQVSVSKWNVKDESPRLIADLLTEIQNIGSGTLLACVCFVTVWFNSHPLSHINGIPALGYFSVCKLYHWWLLNIYKPTVKNKSFSQSISWIQIIYKCVVNYLDFPGIIFALIIQIHIIIY